jgi:HlyD family secretion protein
MILLSTLRNVLARTWFFIRGFPSRLIKSRIALAITVLVVLAAGFGGWRLLASARKSDTYITAKAAYGNIRVTVSASGNIVAVQSVALTFKNQGYVQSCNVHLGDLVKAGQVLATEQTSDLQAAVDQAEANLESAQANYNKLVSTESLEVEQAQAQVDQAKTALDNARSTLYRDQQLLGAGAVSQAAVDADQNSCKQAESAYKSAQIALAQAETHADVVAAAAQLKSAQAQVEQAQNNLSNASIIAPFDGYIATISGNPGMWTGGGAVASGTSTATQFEIIMTSTNLQIDADINEADISKVQVGQPVTFTVDTYPNQTFTGKIIALSPNATTVSNVQMYEARISIDDFSKLKSGMPATINIITASADNVLVIPQSALTYARTYMASLARSGGSQQRRQGGSDASQGGNATQGGASATQGGYAAQGGGYAAQGGASAAQGGYQGSYQGGANSQNRGVVVVLVNGQPQIRRVQTGLSDDVNVQITSGLNVGDIVIIGSSTTSKTSGSTSTGATGSQRAGSPAGGGMMMRGL